MASELSLKNPVLFLKDIPAVDSIELAVTSIYLFSRGKKRDGAAACIMAELICAIGHAIRNKHRLKRDSSLAAKAGAFVLYSFEELGLLTVKMGAAANGHATYVVEILDEEEIGSLWESISHNKTEKLPSLQQYAPWDSSRHATGAMLVKTTNKDVLRKLTPESHPIVFDCINKAQTVGWMVNADLYPIYAWALRNKTDAFADIWELHNPEAKQSKIREAKAIGDIAKRFLGSVFYHLYTYDFRGRKYPATAYFHEQGTDLSRGLLLRADKKAIGESGFFWLCVSIASNWAGDAGRDDGNKTDKIPLSDRMRWTLDNEEILVNYAHSPKVNQGWMKADKPWQFLAACNELLKLRLWQLKNGLENYAFESHLECYIDGYTAVIKPCEFGGRPERVIPSQITNRSW